MLRSRAAALVANANFTDPDPSPEEMNRQADELEQSFNARAAAVDASIVATSVLNDTETRADQVLNANAGNIEKQSKGDITKIKSTGHEIKAAPAPVEPLTAPVPTLDDGMREGELSISCRGIRSAGSYLFELSDDINNAAAWKQVKNQKKSSFTMTGLTAGKRYWVRMAGIGIDGQGPWSQTVSRIVR